MKVDEVKKCSFQNWYNCFKRVTIKSIILPLPDGFVSYILKDGIVLPKSSNVQLNVPASESESDSEETWEDAGTHDEPEAPQFLEFDKSINDAIESLGGKVFPKLNWSSPRDASWIAFNNSCCCTSVSDVYLLLKSSDFIIHDLTQRLLRCEDFENDESNRNDSDNKIENFYLVLRKWVEIDTSGEFRCFVKANQLIGICQREHSLYFDHISYHKTEIVEDILTFFEQHIQHRFPCNNYIFDVYRKKEAQVYLIDFNPFGEVTDSLLFDWDELNNDSLKVNDEGHPEFRYVADNRGVQPRTLSYHALPRDIVDISTGEDSFKLVDLLRLKIEEQNGSALENEENGEI